MLLSLINAKGLSVVVPWLELPFFALKVCFVFLLSFIARKVASHYFNGVWYKELTDKVYIKASLIKIKQNELKSKLQTEDVSVANSRKRILSLSIQELLFELQQRSISALEVLHAFQEKAIWATEETNCITEFIWEAEDWAQQLDASSIKGPLHGLPISIKDSFGVKGYDLTIGLAKHIGELATEDALLVQHMKHLGAVPFCRTNIPQTLLSFDCCNPIYGRTQNPVVRDRVPGGSSGGDGALVKLGGSFLSIGSDIGGSIRIPSNFCGVVGLKPTMKRISTMGSKRSLEGQQGLAGVPGFLARDVDTLVMAFRCVTEISLIEVDPVMAPVEFRNNLFDSQRALKIGYVTNDGFLEATPGCKRAVLEAVTALEKQGHTMVPFTIPDPYRGWDLCMGCLLADGGQTLMGFFKNDLVDPSARITYYALQVPGWLKRLFAGVVGRKLPQMEAAMANSGGCSAYQLWKKLAARDKYVRDFITEWRAAGVDALVVPGFSVPAPPAGYPGRLMFCSFSTILYNLLDFPAGSVPVTCESEADQKLLDTEYPSTGVYRLIKQATVGATGVPLGVQVVGLPWQDEQVLRVMKDLERALGGTQKAEHNY